jgi:tetratricopeptide (TPR) repeat protein
MTRPWQAAWSLVALLSSSCGVTPSPTLPAPAPAYADVLAQADTLMRAGCYRCLLEARVSYEDLTDTEADPTAVRTGLFETSLLIGMRERELGLVGLGTFEHAARLAATTDAPTEWPQFVAMAETTRWQRVGVPKALLDENTAHRRRVDRERESWNGLLRPLVRTSPLAGYLYLSLNCADGWLADQPAALTDDLAVHDDALYVRYRRAMCTGRLVEQSLIETLEPRFTEMKFFLAQAALRAGAMALAEFQLGETQTAWPDWPGPVLGLADVTLAAEDYQPTLGLYDRMLALVPDQRDALLGKAKALSYLDRPNEALPLLDRLAALGQWYLGDIYYWRAWNRFSLDSVEPARADIERAKQYRNDADVLTLAGQIAIEQDRLGDARTDLERALRSTDRACDAAFHLGRVHVAEIRWPETAVTFGRAARCYRTAAEELVGELERIREDPAVPEDRRGRVVAQYATRVAAAQRQAASSAFNAALGYANADALNDAEAQAQQASAHPDFAERADALLARIEARRPAEPDIDTIEDEGTPPRR